MPRGLPGDVTDYLAERRHVSVWSRDESQRNQQHSPATGSLSEGPFWMLLNTYNTEKSDTPIQRTRATTPHVELCIRYFTPHFFLPSNCPDMISIVN